MTRVREDEGKPGSGRCCMASVISPSGCEPVRTPTLTRQTAQRPAPVASHLATQASCCGCTDTQGGYKVRETQP